MLEVVDDAGLDDSDQIRTLSSPSEDLPSHQQPVWVSTGASGKIGESPDEEQLAMPKTKGVYILGYVEGVGCPICVDTSCTKTTISERLYYRIPRERRPKLLPAPKMSMAARGASVQPLGRARFHLQLGTWTGSRLVTVMPISDHALLGDDILRLDSTGPGDIMYTENVLRFAGHKIPLRTVGNWGSTPKVVCLQDEIIPGMSEKVVDAFLERPQGEIESEDSMLVEPNLDFCKRYGCLVTPLLVDIRDEVTIYVCLLNPFPDPIRIPAEAVMGHLEPGVVKRVVQDQEYAEEDNNNYDCRRLTLGSNTNKTNLGTSLTGAIGQPEPGRASDVSSLPNQGWLGQGGLRRLHSKKGLKGMVGQFTTRDVGDNEVLPSQRGELGQGWLSKQIGQSGAESLTCSVVGQSDAEALACLEKSPTKGVGVSFSGPARVRAGIVSSGPVKESGRGSQVVPGTPVRASCIAGVRRGRKRRRPLTQGCIRAQKVRRVADPAPEVESAEGTPVDTSERDRDDTREADEGLEEVPAHIVELMERSTRGWSHPQQQAIKKLLLKHADVFSKDEFDIGLTDLMEHEIDTGDAKPIRSAPRPMAYGLAEGGKKTIDKLLERGIIRSSVSPWAAPVTLVAKKDGTVRLTIDY